MAKATSETVVRLSSGKEIHFDEVIVCSNGFFNVRLNSKYGYLNKDGKAITPIKYEAPADFKNGFATVKFDRNYIKLDELGTESNF